MFMLMFPSMKDSMVELSGAYAQMGSFSTAFGMDKLDFSTAIGFYGVEAGAVIALGGAMFAALIGTGMLAKEEGNHTTEFLYVTPNTRSNLMIRKLVAMVVIVLIFDAICYLCSVLGFVMVDEVPWKDISLFHLAQTIMHLQVSCICFGISAFLRKSNVGLGIGIAMLLYFVNIFANITEDVKWLHNVSPFYYCDGAQVLVKQGIEGRYVAIGVVMAIVAVVIAFVKYNKKDLNI